ncbi:MAG: Lrp/AsnC family transcriptional regulator [Anaerolineales bacterium]|nr:Lrp/AsnC family transcriptional regulator [Anaerolineales bacterium]MDW8227455.1 Lrp/AsnC family transcriptional regulator [Anaerolineales bacterium]
MYEPDELDLRIIDLLLEDGRMPAAKIARRVGNVSERAVRYRIDQMVKDGLIHIGAVVNPRRFGYPVVADVFIEVEPSQIQEVAQRLAEMDEVSYVACSIGELDISIQVVGRNTDDIYRFATEVIGKMPGVRKTTTSIVPSVIKDVYQWRPPRRAPEREESP